MITEIDLDIQGAARGNPETSQFEQPLWNAVSAPVLSNLNSMCGFYGVSSGELTLAKCYLNYIFQLLLLLLSLLFLLFTERMGFY